MSRRLRLRQIAWAIAVLSALAAVLCLYWRPELAFDLASRIWTCF